MYNTDVLFIHDNVRLIPISLMTGQMMRIIRLRRST